MINLAPLQTALDSGDLILTPNNRLKQKLCIAWGQQQAAPVWTQPNVKSLDEWLNQWISHYNLSDSNWPHRAKVVASAPVRRRLWANTLAQFEAEHPFQHPRKTAEQLDQAYNLLCLWQVQAEDFEAQGFAPDHARIQVWINHFHAQLNACNLCTQEQQLLTLLEQTPTQVSSPAILINTESLSPLHTALLNRFSPGWRQLQTNDQEADSIKRMACADAESELTAAANWAKQIISNQPKARIGIVNPDLGNRRAQLERALNQVFEPTLMLPETQRYTPPYNFSAGTPLASFAIIQSALAALGWHQDKSPDQARQWLLSPYIGWNDDQPLRLWLVSWLAQQSQETVNQNALRRALDVAAEQDSLAQQPLELWQNWCNGNYGPATSGAHWGQRFVQRLQAINWPGPRPLDSEEHQQVAQFYGLLEQLREADWLGEKLDLAQAISWLHELASRRPFQPQTPESPIQVLGVLESAGLQFDYLWVLGMEDGQWPPAPTPNPLLPASLQRHLAMPHASAERELDYCRAITQDFCRAAKTELIFSYPTREGDRSLSPSPLISQYPPIAAPEIENAAHDSVPLELCTIHTAPAVDATELAQLRGGASLLQKQARCPLAAFFELRLGARRPEPFSPGLTSLTRGNLLHEALYFFWQRPPVLANLDQDSLDQRIDQAIARALEPLKALYNERLLAIESQRVKRLLQHWLAMEKERPEFAIEALEQPLEFTLGPLPLKLRLDRIDNVNGHWLLIDYKSGKTNINHWRNQPEEPQLPLYAVALTDRGQPVAGIAFGELTQKNQTLTGLCSSDLHTALPKSVALANPKNSGQEDWPALIQHWREQLLNLADALVQGQTPHRYSSPQSQLYSQALQPLLRDAEQAQLHEEIKP